VATVLEVAVAAGEEMATVVLREEAVVMVPANTERPLTHSLRGLSGVANNL
jgi:hypothetical protein